tara:strand:+ start:12568 stop:14112 length:1545 start_codon:yes stop_codon:yes gene_type:complete
MDLSNLVPPFLQFWTKKGVADESENDSTAMSEPMNSDGATEYQKYDGVGGYNSINYAFTPRIENTKQLIKQYRTVASNHEADDAIQEVVDDAIVHESGQETIALDLEDTDFSESIKQAIRDEFANILDLYEFYKEGSNLFKRWYVDSRIYFEKILHENKNKGIKELRLIDPTKLEFVREINKKSIHNVDVVTGYREFFVYNNSNALDMRWASYISSSGRIEIPKEAIVYSHSGLTDVDGKTIIGYLHRAIKPVNQLKMLEDSLVIYRIARAPERRVFYVDTGNLPDKRANQQVRQVMNDMKSRLVYDSSNGTIKTKSNNMTMLEDYYLQRRNGKTATEVSTLPSGQSLGDIEDITFLNQKVYQSLRVPLSRMPRESAGVVFDGGQQITRDELKFAKFVDRLQTRFSTIFGDPLGTNLVLKKTITKEEWDKNKNRIRFDFNKDSFFEESKEIDIIERRARATDAMRESVDKYFSNEWVMKNVWKMSDEQISQEKKKILEEQKDPIFKSDEEEQRW